MTLSTVVYLPYRQKAGRGNPRGRGNRWKRDRTRDRETERQPGTTWRVLYFKERASSRACSTVNLRTPCVIHFPTDRRNLFGERAESCTAEWFAYSRLCDCVVKPFSYYERVRASNDASDECLLWLTNARQRCLHLSKGFAHRRCFSCMFIHVRFVYFIRSCRFFARMVKWCLRVAMEPCGSFRLRCSFLRRAARVLGSVIIF